MSGERGQPPSLFKPSDTAVIEGAVSLRVPPHPLRPPHLGDGCGQVATASGLGGRASPVETLQRGAASSLGSGMEMSATGAALRTPHSQPQRPPGAQTQPEPVGRGRILPWHWARRCRSQPILTARGDGAGGSLQPFVSGRGINYFVLSLRWNKTHFRVA